MRTFLASLVVLISVVSASEALASPEGRMSFALQVSLAPVWFDPADTTSTSIPFIVLYAVHDALVKAMGISVLIAESHLANATRVADRLYAIDRGEIIFDGHPRDVLANEDVMRTLRR